MKTPKLKKSLISLSFLTLLTVACKEKNTQGKPIQTDITEVPDLPKVVLDSLKEHPPEGMIWIPGGTFMQGAVVQDKQAMAHEKPQHPVTLDGFFIDITEVTNAEFAKFVEETGYITVAERPIDWEEMKKQLPEGTEKPADSILQPGSLRFKKSKSSVPNLYDFSQWWEWSIGTNWRHPEGPKSNLEGKENHPVVHVCFEDALAYCKWANRRLPTEAEWEYAARGNAKNTIYFWGDDRSKLAQEANTWEGEFPVNNTKIDGFEYTAPVAYYPPNGFGLFDMAGNVWEFTNDWYHVNYYKQLANTTTAITNPQGPEKAYNPQNPYLQERVIKGGSFLCSDSYCSSFRVSARMATSPDSSAEHVGFRTVAEPDMLVN